MKNILPREVKKYICFSRFPMFLLEKWASVGWMLFTVYLAPSSSHCRQQNVGSKTKICTRPTTWLGYSTFDKSERAQRALHAWASLQNTPNTNMIPKNTTQINPVHGKKKNINISSADCIHRSRGLCAMYR